MITAELTLKTGAGDKVVEVREGMPLFAGRSVECDVYLPSLAVSRRHAVFLTLRGQCGLKDLESANGTYLNGKRISRPMRLKDGDTIQIANFIIEYKKLSGERLKNASRTAIVGEDDSERLRETVAAAFGLSVTETDAPSPEMERELEAVQREHKPLVGADSESTESIDANAFHEDDTDFTPDSADDFSALLGPAIDAALEPSFAADSEPESPRIHIDEDTVRRTRESVRLMPKPPPLPRPAEIEDIEVGDGDGYTDSVEAEDEGDEVDPELALSKAAAEAGLVGEFNPEPEAETAPVSASAVPVTIPGMTEVPGEREKDPNAIPISDEFRAAIESRLFVYSFLADLKVERDELRASKPSMLDAVKAELSRMDREMERMPTPEKAEEMIEKRTQKRRDLKAKVKEAKKKGTALPPLPSKEMRAAEDIAINQWTIIAQSGREALPAAYAFGYKLMESELLAGELEKAGIDAKTLLGGAAYVLALHELLEETKFNRSVTKARLASLQNPGDKKGGKRLLGFLGRKDDDEDEDDGDVVEESYEELAELDSLLGSRVTWINQELAAIELALIKEFWVVYTKVAKHYLVKKLEIPMAVRAFLRYGAVGFNRWWMNDQVRQHVVDECTKDVQDHMEISLKTTNVVYADEYLAAVMNLECTPSMDENLEMNGRNSPEWKADKALRKLIHSRSQKIRLIELCDSLKSRVEVLEQQVATLDKRLKNLLPGSRNYKALKSELSMERQTQKVEISKLTKLQEKIKTTTLGELQEAIDETEERFTSNELPRPTPEFLVERECEAVRRLGRLLANLKERFLPLVLKDNFMPDTDACNDRASIIGEICDIERRDPSIFLETLIPSKKRANRVDLRLSPVIPLLPSAGLLAFSWNPRQKPEDGRLAIPTCFIRPRLRERQLIYLMSDFRWDTSKASAGMDVMNSETIVAAFMGVRWDWRKRSKEGREKGLIYTEQNDRTNWRRVYEAYMTTAYDAGKKLYNRNYDFYERIIGKYFDLPEGLELLRK
ncbi:MAG: FHA domain-containing protein [Planctomycetaceae bacterium]|nr:FHA domain-containing protein [Planctomycetaceae bacterium]